MINDFRYALRQLIHQPAFTLVAVMMLALGIGANTAIFSVVEGTLLRPLPFSHPEKLVRLYESNDENGARGNTPNMSEATIAQWREFGRDIFQGIGAATAANVIVGSGSGEPARNLQAARISANFFSVLEIAPARGRSFTEEEDRSGGPAVAIVSDDFWRSYLNSRPDVVGSVLSLDGVAHTIVGVMPKAFRHPYRAEIWLPLSLPTPPNAFNRYLYAPARLQPGLTIPQAEGAVRRMCTEINRVAPSPTNAHGVYMPPLRESFVMNLRPKILVIVAAALCALLIAAANFAGLLLSRVIEREGEWALRAALGASRRQLIRQQITQTLLLTFSGTLAGILFAIWITPMLFTLSPEGSDVTGSAMREFDCAARMDWPVFGFAAALTMLIGLGFGLVPAFRAARVDLRSALTTTARGATLDQNARRLLGSLVVIELATAAALLMAGITSAQYFRRLIDEPWGFETSNRLVFHVTQSDRLYHNASEKKQGIEAALAQLRALPDVKDGTVTTPSPMEVARDLVAYMPEGTTPPPSGFYLSYLRTAIPGYFKSTGPVLKRGREFLDSDTVDSLPVCIVSEGFVRRFWPGQDPIGKRVKWGRLDGPRPWLIVVGVVGDTKAITDPRDGEVIGMLARPLNQLLFLSSYQVDELTFVVQGKGGPLPDNASIRSALARADSRMAAYQMTSLDQAVSQSRTTERFIFVMVSLFSGLGLILAAIGLYGLLSLQVARRQRELGIRSALGATGRQLIELVARQGAELFSIGLTAGALATWALVRLVHSQWSEMPAPNFTAWGGGSVVLLLVVALACWLPARRAARINPIIALRAD